MDKNIAKKLPLVITALFLSATAIAQNLEIFALSDSLNVNKTPNLKNPLDSSFHVKKDPFWTKPKGDKSVKIPNAYNRKNWNLDLKPDTARIKTAKPYDLLDREYAQQDLIIKPIKNDTSLIKPDAHPYDLLDRKNVGEKESKP